MLYVLIVIGAFLLALILIILIFRYGIDHELHYALTHGEVDNLDFKIKKLPIAKLGKYHHLFMALGLIIALGIVNIAIEWKTYDQKEYLQLAAVTDDFEEVYEIPQTTQPPPPKPVLQHPEIVAVPDEEEIEQEIELNLDVEVTEDTKIEEVIHFEIDEGPAEEKVEEIFLVVEDKPEPIGGLAAFYDFLGQNIDYPEQARRVGISGRVFVEFVVEKDGSITRAHVVKGIGGGCDEEAVRVVNMAPKWKPGMQRGRPVKVRMTVPVFFKLE